MLLLNGFVNTRRCRYGGNSFRGCPGPGSAGASIEQTMLGFDAAGPHLFGARSFADLRVDFYGSQASSTSPASYSGYYTPTAALLRLRTAHAGLYWDKTQAYFALDRPIISPEDANVANGPGRARACVVGKPVDMESASGRHAATLVPSTRAACSCRRL